MISEEMVLFIINEKSQIKLDKEELIEIWEWANVPYSIRENCDLEFEDVKIRAKVMRVLVEYNKVFEKLKHLEEKLKIIKSI